MARTHDGGVDGPKRLVGRDEEQAAQARAEQPDGQVSSQLTRRPLSLRIGTSALAERVIEVRLVVELAARLSAMAQGTATVLPGRNDLRDASKVASVPPWASASAAR